MKRNSIATLALVAMSILVFAPSSFAQNFAKADVPFAFQMGTAQMPAGAYMVGELSANIIVIRSTTTKDAALSGVAQTESSRQIRGPRLVFHKYGDRYFLAEVWGDGLTGDKLPTSKLEKELTASNHDLAPKEEIILAMK